MASRLADRVRSTKVYRPSERNSSPSDHGLVDRDIAAELGLARISNMHLRGMSDVQIAQQMGKSLNAVQAKLRLLRQRWQAVAIEDIDAAVAETLAQIADLQAEYWQAWEDSKAQVMTLKNGAQVTLTGDAQFLDGVMKCIERKCKLLGLDSPIKIDITAQVRQMAIAAGVDPDEAVAEAELILAETRSKVYA